MWNCPYCETNNSEDAAFCCACGQAKPAEVRRPAAQWPAAQAAPAQEYSFGQAAPKKKSKLPWILLAAVLALALIGAGLWFFVFRTHHYRMLSFQYTASDGTVNITTYTYLPDGVTVMAEQRRDGELTSKATGTVDKNGAFTSMTWMEPDGTVKYRYEYENDKYGNHIVMRRYDAEGQLVQANETEYNAYRVIEKNTVRLYEDGQLRQTQLVEFTDESNGMNWRIAEDGTRELLGRVVRIYGDGHRSYQQTNYNADGEVGITYSYILDKDFNVLSYTMKSNFSNNTYTYQWEKIR